ncbi:hypothetical protein M514_26999 [Trichuris suis]|uniref:Uncharacterized protein n=1 Tax=Trichuris suis TaxID=68888 RepID=A0A085MUB4_9BILA|nr:hypothetical protein M514_26999 [Trichuris suis]
MYNMDVLQNIGLRQRTVLVPSSATLRSPRMSLIWLMTEEEQFCNVWKNWPYTFSQSDYHETSILSKCNFSQLLLESMQFFKQFCKDSFSQCVSKAVSSIKSHDISTFSCLIYEISMFCQCVDTKNRTLETMDRLG